MRITRYLRSINWRTLKKTIDSTLERRLLGLASEIAFNTMLSLFPAMLVILTAIGLFENSLQNTFKDLAMEMSQIVPQEVLSVIGGFVTREIAQPKNSSLFSLSFAVAIWTASGAISTAMRAFDEIHQIPRKKQRPFWKAKLISIGLTIGTVILLIIASFLVFISDLILRLIIGNNSYLSFLISIWQLVRWALALSIVSTAFAVAYRYGPSTWQKGTPIFPGAATAAILWALVSALFRVYVERFGTYNKVYGAVGAVIVLMLWLWLSAAIFLVGDQLNVIIGNRDKGVGSRE
ncbi:MAG: YihY/virulence factor BrkB family protein [Calothrix sp. SM1_7_51]|nr:YihY/virulence factor BrkB family protein [Calothrix sp. SM1_7_51]